MTEPPMVDFSVGMSDPKSFPVEGMAEAASEAIRSVGEDFTLYPGGLGHLGLRQLMAERESAREGVEVDPDHIALTNGSMQAVTLMARARMQAKGDVIIAEQYTYSGTINSYRGLGARLVGVPVDNHGMQTDRLERTLELLHSQGTKPCFIYTIPTYQNPSAAVMPLERRQQLQRESLKAV